MPLVETLIYDLAYVQDTVYMATSVGLIVFLDSSATLDLIYTDELELDPAKSIEMHVNDKYLLIVNAENFIIYERNENVLSFLTSFIDEQLFLKTHGIFPFAEDFIFFGISTFKLMAVSGNGISEITELTFEVPDYNTEFSYPYAYAKKNGDLHLLLFDGVSHFSDEMIFTDLPEVFGWEVKEKNLVIFTIYDWSMIAPPDSIVFSVYSLNLPNYNIYSRFQFNPSVVECVNISNGFINVSSSSCHNNYIFKMNGEQVGHGDHLIVSNNDYYHQNQPLNSHNGISGSGVLNPTHYYLSKNSNKIFELWRDSVSIKQIEDGEFKGLANFDVDYDNYMYSKDESIFVVQDSSIIRGDIVDDSVNQIYSLQLGNLKFYRDLGDILVAQQQNNNLEIFSFDGITAVKIYETDQIQHPLEAERVGNYVFILDSQREICKFDLNVSKLSIGWVDNNYSSKKLSKADSLLVYCGGKKILLLDPENNINPIIDEEQYTFNNDLPIDLLPTQDKFYLITKMPIYRVMINKFSVENSEIIIEFIYASENYEAADAICSGNEIVLRNGDNYYWYYDSTVTSVKSIEEDQIPVDFELYQNYPNPFNPVTKIKFTLPVVETLRATSLQTNLTVFDLLGREIAILINKPMQSGTYEVEFDGTELPSGVYIYHLKYGSFSSSKKMVLLR